MAQKSERALNILQRIFSTFVLGLYLGACSHIFKKAPADEKLPIPGVNSPALKPDEAKEMLEDVGEGWLYGEGIGDTALQVGAVLAFPPYALFLLGNGALSISGYETVTVSGMLPQETGKAWGEVYSGIVSVPGQVTAAAAGEEFRTKERIKSDMRKHLKADQEVKPNEGSK